MKCELLSLSTSASNVFRSFNQLIGDLNALRDKDYGDKQRGAKRYVKLLQLHRLIVTVFLAQWYSHFTYETMFIMCNKNMIDGVITCRD